MTLEQSADVKRSCHFVNRSCLWTGLDRADTYAESPSEIPPSGGP